MRYTSGQIVERKARPFGYTRAGPSSYQTGGAYRMEVAALVLEYLKVFLGFSVTVPVTVLLFCLLFRSRIGQALDALLEVTFPGGSAKFARSEELVKYNADVERTAAATAATAQKAPRTIEAQSMVDAFLSLFTLAARLLPLIPKADRARFIEEETARLHHDFEGYRTALLRLADEAPEVPHGFPLAELAGFKPIPVPKV
jgi:hypothetical protein